MGWKEKMKEWGPANLLFLSTDGATARFIVVDEPILLKGKYRGKDQERIGCPVVTDEGFLLFVTGKRTARKLAALEDKFLTHLIQITRHGIEGDTDSKYDVLPLLEPENVKVLQKIASKVVTPSIIKEAVKEAEEVMNQ